MSATKRFGVLFFTLFFCTVESSFASNNKEAFSISEDIRENLTVLMQALCPHIPCGEDGHYLRSATPDEYLVFNAETKTQEGPYYNIADWFTAPIERLTTDCTFALCASYKLLHPVALRTPEEEEEGEGLFFGEFVHSFFDGKNNFLGVISVEPHKTTEPATPHINYYIFKKHQGKKYSTLMISSFVEYLKALEGKELPQITLPKSSTCLEILRNTLTETPDPEKLSLSDIPSSLNRVGPICAHVPLENPPSFVPVSKALFFTGRFHLEPGFAEALGSLIEGITEDETRAVGIHLIFSSQPPDESAFSYREKKLMLYFKEYCMKKREERASFYPILRDYAFGIVESDY
ncbi:MAG: hypothetical protein GW748_02595 [Alphaproteobacteria bacterium]|nr:hypothetical protein [Alphaproteobacteria bacterium]NCQ66616.1 hypothetical protein [Alphaproteobacteria bacterium]NCT06968.1 hypothetical protein [Alphaproteobacteria bacterium]